MFQVIYFYVMQICSFAEIESGLPIVDCLRDTNNTGCQQFYQDIFYNITGAQKGE